MKRRMLVALALALASPTVVAAQELGLRWSRITISPFIGYAFTYTQQGTVRLTDAQQGTYSAPYVREVQGGIMPGVSLELPMPGIFGLSGAIAYNRRGPERLSTEFLGVTPLRSDGSTMWFARAALTVELREARDADDMRVLHPTAHLALGPAIVREVPNATTGRPSYNALALNGSATAELPLPWKGAGVRLALEDYMAYLPRGDVATQLAADVSSQLGQALDASLTGGPTHLYVLRTGVALHF